MRTRRRCIGVRRERILAALQQLAPAGAARGATAEELARHLGMLRNNASADLNELCREGLAHKGSGRPVQFWAIVQEIPQASSRADAQAVGTVTGPTVWDGLVGVEGSLRGVVKQAQAAMLYPPTGLPTLIMGPTGTGKSRLAEAMYHFAVHSGRLEATAPFNVFNCADYASNPQLILSQLFGHVRGAFTGADRDNPGLLGQTHGGVLFLDEVHRLPPEGQEMLFLLLDRGVYRPLGDSRPNRSVSVTLIAATSEDPRSALLTTFLRRFPVVISLPDLENRPLGERLALIEKFLNEEAARVGVPISVSPLALMALLAFRTTGNVGELRSAVVLGCATAFLNYMAQKKPGTPMSLHITHLAPSIQFAYFNGEDAREAEHLVGVEDRTYSPARSTSTAPGEGVPYAQLRQRVEGYLRSGLKPHEVQQLIQTDADYYLRRMAKQSYRLTQDPGGLLDVVGDFVRAAGTELDRSFGPEVTTGLTLHLAGHTSRDQEDAEGSLALVGYCPREYAVVRRLEPSLEKGLGRRLSPSETAYLAMFLAAHNRPANHSASLSVLVIAHGNDTASSMADVANQLLNEKCVLAVDMPLEQSVERTLEMAVQRLREAGCGKGVLLLADMGSLAALGPALEKALKVPAAVVPLVTTAAVIEAGRLAAEGEVGMAEAERRVRNVYQTLDVMPPASEGKRIIITTCLTGQGTARKLSAFLQEALPESLRDGVTIQPVDLENGSELPGLLLEGWKGAVLAAAGTVDPRLPGVPFIGMEQVLFGDGVQSLLELIMGGAAPAETEPQLSKGEAIVLASRFVAESAVAVDGRKAAEGALQALETLEGWLARCVTPAQAVRWVVHFGFMLERLVSSDPVPSCADLPYLRENHAELLQQVRKAVQPIAVDWQVNMPDAELGFLALILLSV